MNLISYQFWRQFVLFTKGTVLKMSAKSMTVELIVHVYHSVKLNET